MSVRRAGEVRREVFTAPDGVRLVADVSGPTLAPTVVLMHGGGQTRHSWTGALQALVGAGYRVVNFDARGHGESDWSTQGAYSFETRARDLLAVLEAVDGPVGLVGASMGGVTAASAVRLGLRPAALVLVDIVPRPEPDGIHRIVAFMTAHPEGFASLEDAADAVAAYNPLRPRPADASGLARNLRKGVDGRLRWHWDPRVVARDKAEEHRELQESLDGLARAEDVPVLLVRGRLSDVVSDASIADFRSVVTRLEVLDVAGAGHVVAGDRNDAFNAGVVQYLARHLPLATASPD